MTETRTQLNMVTCARCGKFHVGVCHFETGACFRCGKTGHVIKDYPLMKTNLIAKPTNGKPRPKIQERVYAVTKKDVESSNTMMTGILHLFSHDVMVLIDHGSTHSFMSTRLVTLIDATPKPLDFDLVIFTLLDKTMIAEMVNNSCVVRIGEVKLLADLILLDLQDFDVILGMDWLSTHHTKVDCYSKEVTISIPNQSEFVFKGIRSFPKIIYVPRAKRLLQKGWLGYLPYVIDNQKDGVHI